MHKVTHEKLTSASNALLAQTHILPPTFCRAAASAHGSLPNSATTAVRVRRTPLANAGTSCLPLTHTLAPICAQARAGSSCHTQTAATHALHHFLHELQFEASPRPARKCKVRKRANTVFVKTHRINGRHAVVRPSIHHCSTHATIPLSTYCRICYNPSHPNAPISLQRSSLAMAQRHACGRACLSAASAPLRSACSTSKASRAKPRRHLEWRWC